MVGLQAKRRILKSRPVRRKICNVKSWLNEGKVKEIDISTNGIKIVTPARVMDNGSEGEVVRVKILKTKKILNGTVRKDGKVEVSL